MKFNVAHVGIKYQAVSGLGGLRVTAHLVTGEGNLGKGWGGSSHWPDRWPEKDFPATREKDRVARNLSTFSENKIEKLE